MLQRDVACGTPVVWLPFNLMPKDTASTFTTTTETTKSRCRSVVLECWAPMPRANDRAEDVRRRGQLQTPHLLRPRTCSASGGHRPGTALKRLLFTCSEVMHVRRRPTVSAFRSGSQWHRDWLSSQAWKRSGLRCVCDFEVNFFTKAQAQAAVEQPRGPAMVQPTKIRSCSCTT